MSRIRRRFIIALVLLVGIPSVELLREEIAYRQFTRKLEIAFQQLRPGMTNEQVKTSVGEPDSTIKRESEVVYYWDAGSHQGALWTLIGITAMKAHYTLEVAFNNQGEVTNTWGGIN